MSLLLELRQDNAYLLSNFMSVDFSREIDLEGIPVNSGEEHQLLASH